MAAVSVLGLASKVKPMHMLASSCFARRGRYAVLGSSNLPTQVSQLRKSTSAQGAESSGSSQDHSKMWTAERILSASLIGLIPAAITFPSDPLNYALAFSLTMHAHWGLEAIVVDYVRPSIFGAVLPKVSLFALYVLSALAFGGLCYFNYSDVGIAQAIRMFWAL